MEEIMLADLRRRLALRLLQEAEAAKAPAEVQAALRLAVREAQAAWADVKFGQAWRLAVNS